MVNKDAVQKLKEARDAIDECLSILFSGNKGLGITPSKRKDQKQNASKINFAVTERKFIKSFAKGLSSPRKLVLLMAYIARGKEGVDISSQLMKTHWNKMKTKNLMGCPFNRKYLTEAKTGGWINSKKQGNYYLTDTWREIFE